MKNGKIILPTDENAARYLTNIKGWVDINNNYFGEDEKAARLSSSTHKHCTCGELIGRYQNQCNECRNKAVIESYKTYPFREWDGKTIVYSIQADRYFRNEDEITDYCDEMEVNESKLMLLHCLPQRFHDINTDQWADILPEDMEELPLPLEDAIAACNAVIATLPPASYTSTCIRTEFIAH